VLVLAPATDAKATTKTSAAAYRETMRLITISDLSYVVKAIKPTLLEAGSNILTTAAQRKSARTANARFLTKKANASALSPMFFPSELAPWAEFFSTWSRIGALPA
jgi:hypothetical protein